MARFFCTYGIHKKIVVPQGPSLMKLEESVRKAFGLSGDHQVLIQYWFEAEGINDWMNLDQDILTTMEPTKIHKLYIQDIPANDRTLTSTSTSDGTTTPQDLTTPSEPTTSQASRIQSDYTTTSGTTTQSTPTAPFSSNSPIPSGSTLPALQEPSTSYAAASICTSPATSKRPAGEMSQSSPSHTSGQKRRRLPWPIDYKLPLSALRADIREKVGTEANLTASECAVMLSQVYHTATSQYENAFYPSDENFMSMAIGISKAFPETHRKSLVKEGEVVRFWHKKIIRRWQNGRSRESQHELEVVARKKGKVVPKVPLPSGPQQFGVTNYLPERPASEDDVSIEHHMETLRLEYRRKKEDQDFEKVEDLMRLTLCERRSRVVTKGEGVESVLEQYPWLSSKEGIIKEFQRLGPKMTETDPTKAILKGINEYGKTLVRMLKNKKKQDKTVKELLAVSNKDPHYIYSQMCGIILGCFSLVQEKWNSLFEEVDEEKLLEPTKAVCIQYAGQINKADLFVVVLDTLVVAECPDASSAVAVLIAGLYVFNLDYPGEYLNFLQIVTNALMSWDDGQQKRKKVLDILMKLDRC